MVDRGKCTFVHKAKNIQKFGGIMGIIVDNNEFESAQHIIMSDDGTGAHVNIPTFLIGKSPGNKIKAQVHKSETEGSGSNSTHHRW
jgi:hypothetical protein